MALMWSHNRHTRTHTHTHARPLPVLLRSVSFVEHNWTSPSGTFLSGIYMENVTLPTGSPEIINLFYNHGSGYTAVTNYRFEVRAT
jgi:hypothetical protein